MVGRVMVKVIVQPCAVPTVKHKAQSKAQHSTAQHSKLVGMESGAWIDWAQQQ